MNDLTTKFAALMLIWFSTVSTDAVFSIGASTVAAVYFASMLKRNIINRGHNGSWREFFKSWFNY